MASNNNEAVIEQFIATLLVEKGLGDAGPEVMEQLKADLKERLNDRINVAIIAAMPPEQLEAFEKKMNEDSDKDLDRFISEQIPDLQGLITQELVAFRASYLYA